MRCIYIYNTVSNMRCTYFIYIYIFITNDYNWLVHMIDTVVHQVQPGIRFRDFSTRWPEGEAGGAFLQHLLVLLRLDFRRKAVFVRGPSMGEKTQWYWIVFFDGF